MEEWVIKRHRFHFNAVVIKLEKQSYPTAAAAESMTVRLIRALKQHPVLNSTKKS